MLSLDHLTVKYGAIIPVNDLTVKFEAAICGLIGPNGAGKTTLLNALSGFATPRNGEIFLKDRPMVRLAPHARARLGLRRMFQSDHIAEDLSVIDNVRASCDHLSRSSIGMSAENALELVGLTALAGEMGGSLNLFQRRMLELARCFVGDPKLILLDEPGAGLVGGEIVALQRAISAIVRYGDCQVIVIDHDIEFIKSLCVQTLVLDFGRSIAFGPTHEVLADDGVRAAYLGGAHHE